ncbi:hypothetical protein [Paraburkholderia tropica]
MKFFKEARAIVRGAGFDLSYSVPESSDSPPTHDNH